MLILSGLVHAKRRRALMVLLWSFVAIAAMQKLQPQVVAGERQLREAAWVHAMPHPSFMLAPPPPTFGAYDPANPEAAVHAANAAKGPHATPAAFGSAGEGWYAPADAESPRPGR